MPKQQFGLVDVAAWFGDTVSSGLIGFAYSSLTSAYNGTNGAADTRGSQVLYNPLFVNMYTNLGVPPIFSMAIDRDPNNGGVMALGGIPNIPHVPAFTSTPIQSLGAYGSSGQLLYEYYTITIGGFATSGTPSTQFNPYRTTNPKKKPLYDLSISAIVDSGTSLLYAPNDVANAAASGFSPPGIYDQNSATYYVNCTATPPTFGVAVGTKIFYVNAADMIVYSSATECISGVQPKNGGLTILGDVWMKNVISVFDIGAEMMRFAAREFYNLTDSPIRATT